VKQYLTEEILEQCVTVAGSDSAFAKILKMGAEIREVGLTPVYIYDDTLGGVEIVTQESLDNKLN